MATDNAPSSSSLLGRPAFKNNAEALQFVEEMTKNSNLVQEKLLAEILNQNKDTEYLKRFNLDGATDSETFKSKLPVVTYEDIKPDIQRIANGGRSDILSVHPITEFFTSSGTSAGEKKLIPITKEEMNHRDSVFVLFMPVVKSYVPEWDEGKGLYFLFVRSETRTPGGLLAQPTLTYSYKQDNFNPQSFNYTSPKESIICPDSFQSMYSQMLCGLLQRLQVIRMGAVFASSLIHAISFLQENWQEFVNDIMSGILNKRITDPSIRDCIAKILKPNPELAEFIRVECSKDNWEGIIPRIWPNAKYIETVVTGAMAQYIPTLDYYSNGLPILSLFYASTECFFGLNLNPMCKPSKVSYTIMPNSAYFEFLLHQHSSSELSSDSSPKLVDLVDVEVGKEYEVVVTTNAGLYRYRVGDILRVTGFHNSAPQVQFVQRKDVLLSIDGDKTEEADLQKAVENAAQLLGEFNTTVVDYTSYGDIKTNPGHYVIYWELMKKDSSNSPTDKALSQCCLEMEESLNTIYRECRVKYKSIGPLEIRVVKKGAFEELRDNAISRGSSMNQYKTPRSVNLASMLELLDSRVISTHFSPASPHWSP